MIKKCPYCNSKERFKLKQVYDKNDSISIIYECLSTYCHNVFIIDYKLTDISKIEMPENISKKK